MVIHYAFILQMEVYQMAISDSKTRCQFTLTSETVNWLQDWLKRNGAPPVMLSTMVDEYLAGIRHTLEEMEKIKDDGKTPTIGDLFKMTGDALNKLKEPPLL